MAVFVADSISLMFFRVRPHTSVCMVSSSFMTSILCLSCRVSVNIETLRQPPYNLINHHQGSGFGMLHTLHVAKYVGSVSLIESSIQTTTIRGSGCLRIVCTRFEEEDICACVIGDEVNVLKYTGPDALCSAIEDQVGVDVHE